MKIRTSTAFIFYIIVICNLQITNAQYSTNYVGSFNGFSSYVAVPNSSNLSPTTAITLEAWVFPTQIGPGTMGVIGKNYQTGYFLGVQVSGRIVFYPKGNSSLRSKVSGIVPANKWTHIAAVYNGSLTQIYINGILDTSTTAITGGVTVNSDSLFLGADRIATQQPNLFFKGRLDNVRIWGAARTGTQIIENRFSPLEIYSPSGVYANLRASFQLDNNGLNYGGPALEIGYPRNLSFINYSNEPVNHLDYNNNLVLNGTTDYFSVNNHSSFNATGAITLEAWIRRDTTGTQPAAQNIVNKSGGTSSYDYALYLSSTGELYFDINSGSFSVHTVPIITHSQWTHVAATYNSFASTPYAIIYINGLYSTSSVFTGSPAIQNNAHGVYIGGIGATAFATNKFKGQIDEVRIWKIERASDQIRDKMYTDESDAILTDFSFDKNTNAIHNGVSTIFAGNSFAGNARISSSHNGFSGQSASPILSDGLTGFYSSYSNSIRRIYIPDNNSAGIKDSVFIPSNGSIINLKAYVLMSHTYTADMTLTLISPSGTSKVLMAANGGSGNDIMTIFSDDADSLPSIGTEVNGLGINAPFSTGIKSLQPLSGFNGQNKQGWWKLKFADGVGSDRGYVHGWGINISSEPFNKTLKLTALIQGFYNSATNKMTKDTARVYLRNVNSPYAIFDSSKVMLDTNGKGDLIFDNISGSEVFYIVAMHRNSIETWSGGGFSFPSDTLHYDFTIAASQAFGANQIRVDSSPNEFAIYGGDVNQDGAVDGSDLSMIDNDAFNFATGYVRTDVDGNNFVDASDAALTVNNASNFVTKIRP